MTQKARIRLSSPNFEQVTRIAKEILDISEKTGAKHSGIIPMPTRKLVIPTRKGPCGGGTESYEKWQMRIHKRMIDLEADERTLHRVMRLDIPESVHMEIELKG